MNLFNLSSYISEKKPVYNIVIGFNNIKTEVELEYPLLVIYGNKVIFEKDIKKTTITLSLIISNEADSKIDKIKEYKGYTDLLSECDSFLKVLHDYREKNTIMRMSIVDIIFDIEFPLFTASINCFLEEKTDSYKGTQNGIL